MPDPDVYEIAGALRLANGLLIRRLRQAATEGELTVAESSTLARLDRDGPATSSALARLDRISPQSMGATLAALEARSLVVRHPDPTDGRRIVFSVTDAGLKVLSNKRDARTEKLAHALSSGFTSEELDLLRAVAPLIERLAQNI